MVSDKFKDACEQVSRLIDPKAHEQRQFDRGDGALLIRASGFAEELFREQGDLELADAIESPFGQYAIARPLYHKPDGEQVGLLYIKLEHPNVHVWLKPAGKFEAFVQTPPEQIPMSAVDEKAVDAALTKALMVLRRSLL